MASTGGNARTVNTQSGPAETLGHPLVTALIGLAFAVIWSSAFTSAKLALQFAPPVLMLAVRFAIAGGLAVAAAVLMGQAWPRTRTAWRSILILGICQNTLYLGLMFVAMTTINAGLGAIIGSAMPIVMAAIAPVFLAERIGPMKLAGMGLGFAGVIWVMSAHLGDPVSGGVGQEVGILCAVIGTIALAVGTAVVKRGSFGTGITMVMGLQMLVGSITLLPFGLAFESFGSFDVTWEFVAALAYIIVFPSLVATWLWFTLLGRTTAANASSFHFFNPVFGVGAAFLVLGEPVGWGDAVGVVLVAVGILVVNRARA
ncbi:MAG: DMT family transporter [Azospirillaceae bacterium]